jgi:hypothetical protein
MLRGLGIAAVVALVAVSSVWAGAANSEVLSPPIGDTLGDNTATAVLSNDLHGARPVALTIRLHAELQCGRLSSSSITVSLPAPMHVPSSVSKTAVVVAGKAPTSVGTRGTHVVIHPAPAKPGPICDVIGPGVIAIKFTRLAGLGNPLHAGSYTFGVVAQPRDLEWHGVLAIH